MHQELSFQIICYWNSCERHFRPLGTLLARQERPWTLLVCCQLYSPVTIATVLAVLTRTKWLLSLRYIDNHCYCNLTAHLITTKETQNVDALNLFSCLSHYSEKFYFRPQDKLNNILVLHLSNTNNATFSSMRMTLAAIEQLKRNDSLRAFSSETKRQWVWSAFILPSIQRDKVGEKTLFTFETI